MKKYSSQLFSLLVASLILTACAKKEDEKPRIQTATVERRDIVIDAQATGVVEPINVVEVKSKASGQIVKMPVETGTFVKPGELLVQVDTRDVRNQYDQTVADVRAAEARVQVVAAQRKRSDDLFAQRIMTAQEHEATTLDHANAQAQLVRARTNLDLAQQRLEDATVRAPVAGTIIDKTVSLGQVITSATGAFGGGTTLLKMADLTKVRVRALVNESDIGNLQAGMIATVIVDAYPDRPFQGTVEKIEPQAVVQQSVTMFPVLVSIANREGLLKPGMNGEVSILIDRRENVLAIPNDAIRNPREAVAAATALGLDPEVVAKQLQAQFAGMGRGGSGGATPANANGERQIRVQTSQGAVALDAAQGQQGQGAPLPQVTDAQCRQIDAAFAKKPDSRAKLTALRERMRGGEIDRVQMQSESRAIYAEVGVDGRVAMACRMRDRDGAPAGQAGDAQQSGSAAEPQANRRSGARAAQPEAGGPQSALRNPQSDSGAAGSTRASRGRMRPGLVFLADSGTFEPRMIRLGVSNYDYTEILGGLEEGDQVALVAAAQMQQQRLAAQERFRGMTGGGAVPGMQRQTPAAGAATPGAGGGGAARGRP
ncbi:MAG: efflux RND transporter periplasmic adaptor subunit [Anaerolineae bacterium]|nr:efflux RND transporter periplasmic adaptor subunit [Gemmatimonadaceae bacterium]